MLLLDLKSFTLFLLFLNQLGCAVQLGIKLLNVVFNGFVLIFQLFSRFQGVIDLLVHSVQVLLEILLLSSVRGDVSLNSDILLVDLTALHGQLLTFLVQGPPFKLLLIAFPLLLVQLFVEFLLLIGELVFGLLLGVLLVGQGLDVAVDRIQLGFQMVDSDLHVIVVLTQAVGFIFLLKVLALKSIEFFSELVLLVLLNHN